MMRGDATVWRLAGAFGVLLAAGTVLPEWLVFLLTLALAKGLVVLGLLILMRAGLVSFGQGLFYCFGAYAAGMLGHFLGVTDIFLLVAVGTTAPLLLGLVLGFLFSRYRDIFFAMLSLAFSMILYGLLVKVRALGSTDGFNVGSPTFVGFAPEGEPLRDAIYALACVLCFLAAAVGHRYLKSTRGYLGEAIRENELRVEYLGASVRRVVHFNYVVAAGIAGSGGVLTAIVTGHIDPEMTYWTTSGEFVFVALLSGIGGVGAPFLGSILFELVRTYAFAYAPYIWQLILGASMLLVILFLPGGIWSLFRARIARR